MKTVVFYSYKGGQGRSTAVANLASFLYRLDKVVAVLDLDVESPGLPPKLTGESVFAEHSQEKKAGGIVSYVIAVRERPKDDPPSLEGYASPVFDTENRLILIPTGFIGSQRHSLYRQMLAGKEWSDFARVGGLASLPNRVATLDAIQRAVEELSPAIEYLLVDLGAGLSELAESVFTAWSGPILFFFSLDQENIEGTNHVLNQIGGTSGHLVVSDRHEAKLMNSARNDLQVLPYPVLSRVGPFASDDQINTTLGMARRELGLRPDDPLLFLRSDPDLEEKWHLHCPLDLHSPVEQTPLTGDYLRLLATVAPEVSSAPTFELKIKDLHDRFGLPEKIPAKYKVFRRMDGGVLLNMADDQRNVSFKVRTFCGILDDLHSNILSAAEGNAAGSSRASVLAAESKFRQAGLVTGERFGIELVKLWAKHDSVDDYRKLLQYWCDFDSEVGFGVLTCELQDAVLARGAVMIGQNFLADGRSGDHDIADLCQLLVGYIAGVLGQIFRQPIAVSHSRERCMRLTPARENCQFIFERQAARV